MQRGHTPRNIRSYPGRRISAKDLKNDFGQPKLNKRVDTSKFTRHNELAAMASLPPLDSTADLSEESFPFL